MTTVRLPPSDSLAPGERCRECTAKTGVCANQNGGMAGFPCKENGFGVAEKRMRDGEDLVSSVGAGGDEIFKRSFQQDCPEAPLRKRVHVCESQPCVVEERFNNNVVEKATEGISGAAVETLMRLYEGQGSEPQENRRLPARTPPAPRRPGGNGDGGNVEGMAVEGADVEMAQEGLDEIVEEDLSGHPSSVPQLERTTPVEMETTDMEVDPSNSDRVATDDGVGSPAEEQEQVKYGGSATQEEDQEEDVVNEVPPLSEHSAYKSTDGVRELDMNDFVGFAFRSPNKSVEFQSNFGFGEVGLRDFVREGQVRGGVVDPGGVYPPPADNDLRRGAPQQDAPQDAPKADKPRRGIPRPDVVIIEVDDSDDEPIEMKDYESDGSSTKGTKPICRSSGQFRRYGYRFSSQSTSASHSPDEDSDSDDCRVVGSFNPNPKRGGNPPVQVIVDEESDSEDNASDSSDVVVVGAAQSTISRMWEEAAMRKRMGRAMGSEGSKANGEHEGTANLDDKRAESQGFAESVSTSTYHGSPNSKDQTETSEARGVLNATDGQQRASFNCAQEERPVGYSERADGKKEAKVVENHYSRVDSEGPEEMLQGGIRYPVHTGKSANEAQEKKGDSERLKELSPRGCIGLHGSENEVRGQKGDSVRFKELSPQVVIRFPVHLQEEENAVRDKLGDSESLKEMSPQDGPSYPVHIQESENDVRENQGEYSNFKDDVGKSSAGEDFLEAKEKLKNSAHYRKADAAEWASRQQEIQRQAVETKRLRQRKKLEADRKQEMERKQKQRIEDLRLSQLKEERDMGLKEQVKGQVRIELERIASTCKDFVTLLRRLGVLVEGGSQPTIQQVNAAYKKAVLKFHPDRATASAEGDLRSQAEAEEKFKLITQLRSTLKPVAIEYHPTFFR